MRRAVIISGPTASGKTDLAFSVADNLQSVIINADSKHIYRGLDIISGKDIPDESVYQSEGFYKFRNTRLYLFDIADTTQDCSVRDYTQAVREVIKSVPEDIPLIFVGGSNFYISALTQGIETLDIPPNISLRDELASYSVLQLQEKLQEVDAKKFALLNKSDINNPRRLIRAIEVGKWKENNLVQPDVPVLHEFEVFHIGLTAPLDYLRKKIDARVESRLASGAFDEAEKLFKKYDSLSSQVKTANGYQQLFEHFRGEITKKEALERWKYSEYHNAKKQLTWIHGDKNIKKFSINDKYFKEKVLSEVLEFVER